MSRPSESAMELIVLGVERVMLLKLDSTDPYVKVEVQPLPLPAEDSPEVEALHQPAPGEWSVKETLAHLVLNERELHAWITDLIVGDERLSDANPTNVPARLAAVTAVFSTLPALAEEHGALRRELHAGHEHEPESR